MPRRRFAALAVLLVAVLAPLVARLEAPSTAFAADPWFLSIELSCHSKPEYVKFTNTANATLRIADMHTLYGAGSEQNYLTSFPGYQNKLLKKGQSIMFLSGSYSGGPEPTATYVAGFDGERFTDSKGADDGVWIRIVRNSASTEITKRCPAAPPASSGSPKVAITLNCASNPETTRIKNTGTASVTIRTIGSLYRPRSNEPFSVNKTLAAGASYTYQTGAAASSHVLTNQYIYSNGVSSEGVRVTTSAGTVTKKC